MAISKQSPAWQYPGCYGNRTCCRGRGKGRYVARQLIIIISTFHRVSSLRSFQSWVFDGFIVLLNSYTSRELHNVGHVDKHNEQFFQTYQNSFTLSYHNIQKLNTFTSTYVLKLIFLR